MQLDKIVSEFNFEKVILFDKDAIIVYKKGEIEDMLIVELTTFYKQMSTFEIISSDEVTVELSGKIFMSRKLDDYFLAVIYEKKMSDLKTKFKFNLMYNRLKRELI